MGTFAILQKGYHRLKTVNGWIVIPKDFADYGTDYTTRAGIALVGLGGIRPIDVVYPTAFDDGDGQRWIVPTGTLFILTKARPRPAMPLGPSRCTTRKASTCPTPSTATPFPRGCRCKPIRTVRWISTSKRTSPGADKEANWLPAPASGQFNLTVRNYWPTEAVLDGSYKLPPVKKVQ